MWRCRKWVTFKPLDQKQMAWGLKTPALLFLIAARGHKAKGRQLEAVVHRQALSGWRLLVLASPVATRQAGCLASAPAPISRMS
jgi:hypothetical protein